MCHVSVIVCILRGERGAAAVTSLCSVQFSVGPNCKALINFIKIDRVIKSSKKFNPIPDISFLTHNIQQ